MKIKTKISQIKEDGPIIHGETINSMIDKGSFSDSIFFLLQNRWPKISESKIFERILISIIDHGAGTTSTLVSRLVQSGGNSLNTSVGAGILAQGDYHGGAIENAMKQFKEVSLQIKNKTNQIETIEDILFNYIKEIIDKKKTMFGFGHKIYKKKDPRVKKMLNVCKKYNYSSKYLVYAELIESTLEKIKNKKICFNIDGFIACVLLEMGFSHGVGKGIFIIGRVPGLVAHSIEEKNSQCPVKRLKKEDIIFIE